MTEAIEEAVDTVLKGHFSPLNVDTALGAKIDALWATHYDTVQKAPKEMLIGAVVMAMSIRGDSATLSRLIYSCLDQGLLDLDEFVHTFLVD